MGQGKAVGEPKDDFIKFGNILQTNILLSAPLMDTRVARELAQILGKKHRPGGTLVAGFALSPIRPKSLMSYVFWGRNVRPVTNRECVSCNNSSDSRDCVSNMATLPPIVPTAVNRPHSLSSRQEIVFNDIFIS